MQIKPFKEIQIEEIQKDIATKQKEYIRLKGEVRDASDPSIQQKLEDRASKIKEELEKLEKELDELENNTNHNKKYLNIEDKLKEFDCWEAVNAFQSILKNNSKKGQGGLILLQKGNMGGKHCLLRLRELLAKDILNKFRYYPVNLYKIRPEQNEIGLLKSISDHFIKSSTSKTKEELSQEIIAKIHDSVQESYHTVYIEIIGYDYLSKYQSLLPWFHGNFWLPLQQQISETARQYPYIRFIIVILIDGQISTEFCPKHLCCSPSRFHPEKIVKMTLKKCKNDEEKDEVKDWICKFTNTHINEVEQLVETIYETTKGNPDLIYEKLKLSFTQ